MIKSSDRSHGTAPARHGPVQAREQVASRPDERRAISGTAHGHLARPVRSRRMTQLENVLLGNNPYTDTSQGWAAKSGRTYDLNTVDYVVEGAWSIAANRKRIGAGTVGWIRRPSDPWHQSTPAARWGFIAGVVVFTSDQPTDIDDDGGANGVIYYPGPIWRFPREWWIDGARINLSGWGDKAAPFGSDVPPQFASGRRIDPQDAKILYDLVHPVAFEWIDYTVRWAREQGGIE